MEAHERAYEAFIEYTTWCFANPNATDNDRLMAQWRIASAAGLAPHEKAYLDAHVYADNKAVKDPRNLQGNEAFHGCMCDAAVPYYCGCERNFGGFRVDV